MPRWQPVFIGPVCVGKSTVSALVAAELDVPRVELDEVAMAYYRVAPGFDPDEYNRLRETAGFVAAYRYWEPAVAYALERVVEDEPAAVLDLGAGHTSFLDRANHSRVRNALAPYDNVVLLLPHEDPEVSIRVIRDRLAAGRDGWDWVHDGIDFIRNWVIDEQNRTLADHVVYAGDDDPRAVADRVIARLRR